MEETLKILHLEDDENDVELICSLLRKENFKFQHKLTKTKEEFEDCLEKCDYNIILSDYTLPSYDGNSALEIARKVSPDIPFIFVSGTIGEDVAISCLINGADDYVLKNNMKRLGAAIRRANTLYKERNERIKAEKALKESEQKFRNVFENSTIGIYRSSPDGKFILANKATLNIFGLNSFEDLYNLDFKKECYVDSSIREKFEKLLADNGKVYGFEGQIRKKDGSNIYTRESAVAVKDESGKAIFYDGVIEDISKNKLAENAIIEAKEKAERSEKLKTEFLHQISHEIRTPMNVIINLLKLIEDEVNVEENEELAESFAIVESSGKRITRTINQILNMSELQTNLYTVKKKTIDLYNEVLLKIYGEFRKEAKAKGIELKISKDLNNSLILGDEYSISQIFYNLIDNAIKFTEKGKVEISIYNEKDDFISVGIKDTGIGISKNYINKIFEPFCQEDSGTNRKFDGTGLGLSLVKEYCEINYADLSVESIKGKGAMFKVTFLKKHSSI